MAHQQTAVAKLLPSRVGGLFMDMGAGKSRTLIELARLRHAKVDHVVWFTPMSLKETVKQEILKHTDCLPEDVHVFGPKTRADKMPKARWHVVGIESMASSSRIVLAVNALVTSDKRDNLTYIIHATDDHRTRRHKALEGMDEARIIALVCANTEYQCIGDLCMGRGLVGRNAYLAGKPFVGTELNKKRLAVLVDWIMKAEASPSKEALRA